jgi:hypothetical protein
MNDNDVILWQARTMANHARLIDQMGRGLDEAQVAARNMVPASELEASRAIVADLQACLRDERSASEQMSDRALACRSELDIVRGQRNAIMRERDQALAEVRRLNDVRPPSPPVVTPYVNDPSASGVARLVLRGLLDTANRHDLTRAEIMVYLYLTVHGSGARNVNMWKALGLNESTPLRATRRLRSLGLIKGTGKDA